MVVVRTRHKIMGFVRRNHIIAAPVLVAGRINRSHIVLDLHCPLSKVATRSGGIVWAVKISGSKGFVSAEHSDLWTEKRNDVAKIPL